MVTVYIDDEMNLEKAIRRFKKQCEKEGIFEELRQRQYYTRPGIAKRLKWKRNALRRLKEEEELRREEEVFL